MFDEQEKLLESPLLLELLSHYARPGLEDREPWQDRVMDLEGAAARDLVRMHGELIAFGWLEQNTGMTPVLKEEIAAACYRITRDGLRTFKALPKELKKELLAREEPEAA